MSSESPHRISAAKQRFSSLLLKHQAPQRQNRYLPEGFALTKTGHFIDGNIDILDILAFRDKQNKH